MRRRLVLVGLVIAALTSANIARADEGSSLRLDAGVTVLQGEDLSSRPGFVLGGSVALAHWAPSSRFLVTPYVGLLFVRSNAHLAPDGAMPSSITMDSVEVPLLLRGELILGGRSFYAMVGAHGSFLLQAQRTGADGITRELDLAAALDGGLLAGGGFELTSFALGEIFLEMRYQRSGRRVLSDSDSPQESLAVLLGYELGGNASDSSVTWNAGRSLALRGGVLAASAVQAERPGSAYGPGFALGGAFSPFRLGRRVTVAPELEVLFVHRSTPHGDSGESSLAMDTVESSLLVRGGLELASRSVYGLGGVYGSALVRAQRDQDGISMDVRDSLRTIDVGWTAGAGIDIASTSRTRFSLEVRYQRGLRGRSSVADDELVPQSISCLLGISQGVNAPADSGSALIKAAIHSSAVVFRGSNEQGDIKKRPARRMKFVLIGQPGDRWLSTIQFTKIERATRDGEYGYNISYNISGHGSVVLFWPRSQIDFDGSAPGHRRKAMKLRKGQLWYPTRITHRSLPRVHGYILDIEKAYARQADGVMTALEGFAGVAGLKPRLRTPSPRAPSKPTTKSPAPDKVRPPSQQPASSHSAAKSADRAKVHKSSKPAAKASAVGTGGVMRAVAPSSRALGRALEAAGHVRPPGGAAHHIVAGRASLAGEARAVLRRFRIGINDAANGVFLPASSRSQNGAAAAVHSRIHTEFYYLTVNALLRQAKTREQALRILESIRQALLRGGL